MSRSTDAAATLTPYVPRVLATWEPAGADPRHLRVTGSLAFLDISGFTRLTERLARKGKVGAEEMSDVLSATFSALLADARDDGADLVKWGGDAVLLLFRGADHAERAARSAHRMRATLRRFGRTASATGALRMSVGIHSGDLDLFLVGDPALHRELLVCGPGATLTAATESAAGAGQIGLTAPAAALLPARLLGADLPGVSGGRILRSAPVLDDLAPAGPRPRRFDPATVLPAPIREHLLQPGREPEHRLITVAFVQYSGTDGLLASDGAGVVADELDRLVRRVQHACADHEVTFFETDIAADGGKIMLTAGAPRSAGHDEERMLRVARRVLDEPGRLDVRIGINRGRVFAGDFGPTFRRTYSVKGDAVNLAARVTARAGAGEALATLPVLDHAQSDFATTELPPFTVKGKSAPVRAAVVGAVGAAREHTEALVPLAGREAELTVLREALAAARSGEGRVVDVVGEPGIGKSRLVTELLAECGDVRVVQAPCAEYESSTPYYPFRRLLREALDLADDPAELLPDLRARVADAAPELLPWLPLLGLPLNVALPATREVEELDEQFRTTRLEGLVTSLLRWSLAEPAVLVVEDAHLLDDASADLLRAVLQDPAPRPWLVVVTRRELPGCFTPDGPAVTVLRPSPLPTAVSLAFVRAAVGDHPLTTRDLAALAERGGGNPLFLEALAAEARRADGETELPESVEGLVTSQIDRLAPADRTVLRYAAVLGTVVDEEVLAELAGGPLRAGHLARLSGFVGRDPAGTLRFRNALIRDVAYEGLPFRSRRALHDRVGSVLERSGRPEDDCEVLSLHFFHAGRHDRAWRYSVLAGERALAKYAHGDALDHLGRAVRAAPHTDDASDRDLAHVLEQLADALFVVGRPDDAAAAYARARRHLRGEPVLLAGIVEKEARIDHRHRRYSQAMRRITRGLHALDGRPGREAGVARSLLARRYAFSRFNQGRVDEALRWAGLAADEAEEAVDADALAQAYEMLNAVHAGSGRPEPLPYGRLALAAYTELGNLPRQGHCLNNLAVQAFTEGRWDDALTDYRRADEIFRRIGDTANESNALYNRAELLVRQGREAEAGPLLEEVLRTARAVQDDELVALALREQARVVAATGDVAGAVEILAETRAGFVTLDEADEVTATDLALAEVLVEGGRTAEAAPVLAGVPPEWPTALRVTGLLHVVEDRPDDALDTLTRALAAAREDADRYEEGLVLQALADPSAPEVLGPMGVVRRQPTLTRASLVKRK